MEAIDHPVKAGPADAQIDGGRADRGGAVLLILDQNQLANDRRTLVRECPRLVACFQVVIAGQVHVHLPLHKTASHI